MTEAPSNLYLDTHITFNNGVKAPRYTFGTWRVPADKAKQVVINAINSGFRHLDCARIYKNEPAVGQALSEVLGAADAKLTRGDLFITSKLWNSDQQPENVEAACRRTLADLGCGYLDLYLIHWPICFKHVGDSLDELQVFGVAGVEAQNEVKLTDTWKAMEKLVELGLTKSIGLSNCSTEQVDSVLKIATIKPVVNQVEMHPALPQIQLRKDMQERGIVVSAYSPLGYGFNADKSLLDDAEIQALAAKVNMSPALFLLSFIAQMPNTTLLTKSETLSRIQENAKLTTTPFPAEISEALLQYGLKNPKRTILREFFEEKGPLYNDRF
jgi:diketogulonate reductase-like aldo/keto reductase